MFMRHVLVNWLCLYGIMDANMLNYIGLIVCMECWYKHILLDWFVNHIWIIKGLELNGLSGMNLLIIPQGYYLFIYYSIMTC